MAVMWLMAVCAFIVISFTTIIESIVIFFVGEQEIELRLVAVHAAELILAKASKVGCQGICGTSQTYIFSLGYLGLVVTLITIFGTKGKTLKMVSDSFHAILQLTHFSIRIRIEIGSSELN
jgi:hypothetical protein